MEGRLSCCSVIVEKGGEEEKFKYGINLLKTETMVSKNQATEAEGRGSLVFRDHSLGFKKV